MAALSAVLYILIPLAFFMTQCSSAQEPAKSQKAVTYGPEAPERAPAKPVPVKEVKGDIESVIGKSPKKAPKVFSEEAGGGKAAWKPAELPALLKEVEAKYAKASTMKTNFRQVNYVAAFETTKESKGVIWFKRPDKIRWETQSPERNTLVSDGHMFWFYTPPFEEGERGQVLVRDAGDVKTQLASALLSGTFSMARDMVFRQGAKPNEFDLVPKKGTAGTVVKAGIEIDEKRKLIRKVTLHHKGGNKSDLFLSGIEIGPKVIKDLFEFEVPPYADVVTE